MLNELLLKFAQWVDVMPWSDALHGSFYMYNWIESTHVLTLMLSLGTLSVIDLRMLGLCLTNVPASTVADRLAKPMAIGFIIMFVTGVILFFGIPVRTTQSIWFRIKVILLIVAAINAWTFHRHMRASVSTWDTAAVPPCRTRIAAGTSLAIWTGVVICGRFIAYDWFDCGKPDNSAFINWAAGCIVDPSALSSE